MTLAQVMDHYALAFGLEPTLRPHGLYPCGGCGGSFATGQVCIVVEPGGGRFLCGACNMAESTKVPADNRWRVERNTLIYSRVLLGEATSAVAMAFNLSQRAIQQIVKTLMGAS